jgi:hypothetical protein
MQAQEFGPAKWSVGQRTTGCSDLEVSKAIADGRILRTHTLRPTWHFVARDDIRWIMTVTAPRVHQASTGLYRRLELDEKTLARAHKAIAGALKGGHHRTRGELANALAEAGIDAKGQRLAYIVMHAELEALICSGAPRGKQQTYALVEERAPKAMILSPDEALAELTRRYYTSHGPATVKDLAKWASLTMAEVKRGLEMVGGELISETIDGRSYWFAEQAGPLPPIPSPTAHLLQIYDELFMGYFESRDHVNIASLTTNPAIWPLMHAVLLDGKVVGNWQRTVGARELRIDIQPNRQISAEEQAAIQAAAESYGAFAGLPASVEMNQGK